MNNDIEIRQAKRPDAQLSCDDDVKPPNMRRRGSCARCAKITAAVLGAIAIIALLAVAAAGIASAPSYTKSEKEFIRTHPGYGLGGNLYKLRRQQFPQLKSSEVYLDYTGAGMYQIKQIRQSFRDLRRALYCNTHSLSSCSKHTEKAVEDVRNMILDYFNAPKGAYSVIFTQSATAALRIVGDTFPWSDKSLYLYAKHNHNSVLGIRKLALERGAKYQTLPWDYYLEQPEPEKRYGAREVMNLYYNVPDDDSVVHNLIAFPAECNFSGIKYPLDLIHDFETGKRGEQYNEGYWHVLLDAAAFVPTNRLDLN